MLQVFAWGSNASGQLGLEDTVNRAEPTLVAALWAMPVAALAAGDAHSVALTTNGFVFAWGCNTRGQLGLPASADAIAQVVGAQRSYHAWHATLATANWDLPSQDCFPCAM